MSDFAYDEARAYYYRAELRRRYGEHVFVAVFEGAVIDWGRDLDKVRERAEKLVGEPVYVTAISRVPKPEPYSDAETAESEHFRALRKVHMGRRRVPMSDTYDVAAELDIIGQKTEYYQGCIRIDGWEKRFAEHDYRLLVERGAIPRETVLIAGIVFWKDPPGE